MSSFDTSWDIEKYKNEHETKEHWELRKSFLLAHKEKFPENELACLAQVFVNVEMLGCRYPAETMQLVQELSESVAEEYREKKKKKLQRTFVKASDAASSKAKVSLNNNQQPGPSEKTNQKREINYQSNFCAPAKKVKLDVYGTAPYGEFIMFTHPGYSPKNVIDRISCLSSTDVKWELVKSTDIKFKLSINGKLVAEGSGATEKLAKQATAEAALEELQKYYYTIKVNKILDLGPKVSLSDSESKELPNEEFLGDDNIGKKLMKLMGWSGGGLGKTEQGIKEPVNVRPQMSRKGLGLTSDKNDMSELKRKCRDVIRNFMNGDMKDDLVFSSDFSNEERAAIHVIARQMGVKSQSSGPKNKRTLRLSRKIDPAELVMELKELGGSTAKYELIEPTQ